MSDSTCFQWKFYDPEISHDRVTTPISSDKILQIIEQQPISTESFIGNILSNDNVEMIGNSSLPSENNQWNVRDLCLCLYSEDDLMYKATIINIGSLSYIVSFDDYRNGETHPLIDLQL